MKEYKSVRLGTEAHWSAAPLTAVVRGWCSEGEEEGETSQFVSLRSSVETGTVLDLRLACQVVEMTAMESRGRS